MYSSPENKKSMKYANIDMDKFKFDFNLFVTSEDETTTIKEETRNIL